MEQNQSLDNQQYQLTELSPVKLPGVTSYEDFLKISNEHSKALTIKTNCWNDPPYQLTNLSTAKQLTKNHVKRFST